MALRLASIYLQRGDIHNLGHILESINVLSLEEREKGKYYYLKGIYNYEISSLDESIINFQRSRMIFTELGDYDSVSECLVNVAQCYESLNNFKEAAKIQESLLAYMEAKFGNKKLTAQVLSDLAINYARMENYTKVIPLLNRADELAYSQNDDILRIIIARKFVEYYEVLGDNIKMKQYENQERKLLNKMKNLES